MNAPPVLPYRSRPVRQRRSVIGILLHVACGLIGAAVLVVGVGSVLAFFVVLNGAPESLWNCFWPILSIACSLLGVYLLDVAFTD